MPFSFGQLIVEDDFGPIHYTHIRTGRANVKTTAWAFTNLCNMHCVVFGVNHTVNLHVFLSNCDMMFLMSRNDADAINLNAPRLDVCFSEEMDTHADKRSTFILKFVYD